MTIEIIDTPQNVTRFLPRLGEVHTIIRYITRGNPSGSKHIQLPEVRAIASAGKKLAIVHETWGDFAHAGSGGISASDGVKDGAYARRVMPKLGAPAGACVYFAVDMDGTAAQLRDNVLPYFKAIRTAFGDGEFTVGIYGPGQFCQAVMDAGYADYFWLANAKGWKGYKAFLPKAHLVQRIPTHIAGGLDVDPNEAQVEEWGQFVPFIQDKDFELGEPQGATEATEVPLRLGSGEAMVPNVTDAVTSIASVATSGGILGKVKSLFRSKIAATTTSLGAAGAGTAISSDPLTSSLAMQLLQRPSFWIGLAFVLGAAAVCYFYWRDHGRGSQ